MTGECVELHWESMLSRSGQLQTVGGSVDLLTTEAAAAD